MRVLKIVVRSLVAMLGLSVLCIVLAAAFFNPNSYRGQIEAWVVQQTGRSFTLDGDLQWSWWPQVAIALPAMRLGSAPSGEAAQDFLNWQQASISVRLWPLLRGRLQLGTLRVRGLRLVLARNANGEVNWQDLLDRWSADQSPSRWQFDQLEGLRLQDAQVQFTDAMTQRSTTLQIDQLHTSAVRFDAPIDLDLTAQLHTQQSTQSVTLPGKLHAQLQADAALQQVQVAKLEFNGTLSSDRLFVLTTRSLPLSLILQDSAWQAPLSMQAPSLSMQVGEAHANGHLQITTAASKSSVTAALPSTATAVPTRPQIETSLQIAVPNLRRWLQTLGIDLPPTSDATVLQSLAMSIAAHGDVTQMQIQLLAAQLDQSHLSGSAELRFDTPAYRGVLQADVLNLDRYMPSNIAIGNTKRAAAIAKPIPLTWLRGLPVQGALHIEHAQWQGIKAQRLSIKLDGE